MGVIHISQKWGSTDQFGSISSPCACISALWFFGIKSLVMCFFENIHLLLTFKCFIALFGVAIDWYSCLCYALCWLSLGRLSCLFTPRCISLRLFCLVFCLGTSKSLSMGEFDQCHICIGYSGYLGFNFCGLICIYLRFKYIFSNYVRFWFVELLLLICMIQAKYLRRNMWINPR